MALDPVMYRGELVALAGDERFHIISPRLQNRLPGDPELCFVAFMCLCKAEVAAGRVAGPYTSELAERWAEAALGQGPTP